MKLCRRETNVNTRRKRRKGHINLDGDVGPPGKTGGGRVRHIISQPGTRAQGCLSETVGRGVRNASAGSTSTNARKQGVRLEDNLSGPWTDSPGLAWMGSEDLEFGPGSGSPGSAESLGNQRRPVVTPENSRSLEEAYTYDANTMITTES